MLTLSLSTLVLFVLIPAIVFTELEPWNYRQGVYFAVVTLTTVGFGDLVLSQEFDGQVISVYKIVATIWLWMGLAVVSATVQNWISAVQKL